MDGVTGLHDRDEVRGLILFGDDGLAPGDQQFALLVLRQNLALEERQLRPVGVDPDHELRPLHGPVHVRRKDLEAPREAAEEASRAPEKPHDDGHLLHGLEGEMRVLVDPQGGVVLEQQGGPGVLLHQNRVAGVALFGHLDGIPNGLPGALDVDPSLGRRHDGHPPLHRRLGLRLGIGRGLRLRRGLSRTGAGNAQDDDCGNHDRQALAHRFHDVPSF